MRAAEPTSGQCRAAGVSHGGCGVQAAILGGVEKVGAMLSADSPAVLDLVQSSPAAAAPVMLHFLRGALTRTGGVPPPPLVDAALAHYERSQDVQLLALIMPGMPPALALQNVAHLVRMPRDAFLAAIRNVVHAPDGRAGVLNPRELLIQLHLLDPQAVNVRPSTCLAGRRKRTYFEQHRTGSDSQFLTSGRMCSAQAANRQVACRWSCGTWACW